MIEETAIVVERSGGFAWVETQRRSTCGTCGANKSCGTSVLANVVGRKTARMKAINTIDAAVGDEVVVGLRESALLIGSVAVYLVPLLCMLGGAMLGRILAVQWGVIAVEPVTVVAGLLGLLSGGLWLRGFTKRISNDERYQPVILRRAQTYIMASRV